ncbi:hypothetical protein EMIT036CA2_30002 [Chryseobacterium sp. IT-36CA2]
MIVSRFERDGEVRRRWESEETRGLSDSFLYEGSEMEI